MVEPSYEAFLPTKIVVQAIKASFLITNRRQSY